MAWQPFQKPLTLVGGGDWGVRIANLFIVLPNMKFDLPSVISRKWYEENVETVEHFTSGENVAEGLESRFDKPIFEFCVMLNCIGKLRVWCLEGVGLLNWQKRIPFFSIIVLFYWHFFVFWWRLCFTGIGGWISIPNTATAI